MFFPLVAPWFLVGLATSSSSSQKEDSSAADRYLKPFSLEMYDFEATTTGRGIRTLVDRSPGDILLQVPVGDTIKVSNFRDRLPVASSSQEWTEEQLIAIGILLLKSEEHPYVSTMLPKQHYSIWTLPLDLWEESPSITTTSSNIARLPKCYRETFQATRNMVLDFSNSVSDDYALADALWAFSMVRSRSIAVPELKQDGDSELPLGLIPGLDLFNHAFGAGTLLQLVDDQWTLTSSKSYQAGEQIFLSYGEDKDNWKLVLTYGFSVGGTDNNKNPNNLVFWTWEDLLTAAGQVRPNMFPERVQRQLLQHPQLKVYVTAAEDRATFSYDGNTNSPRDSLQTGLTLLSSLATQLGFPEDDALPNDVLERLVKNRVAELEVCKTSSSGKVPPEWKPFFNSLKLALEEEEESLRRHPREGQ